VLFLSSNLKYNSHFSLAMTINRMLERRLEILNSISTLAECIEFKNIQEFSCERAMYFYSEKVKPMIDESDKDH
jgi:hypothetical protein